MNNDTALTVTESTELAPTDVSPVDLQAALAGDISRLSPEAKLRYYGAICKSVGLNPLTKPFDWLSLQGKLILYANKGCAEQLRSIHGVNVEIVERKFEHGCYIVRIRATSKSGRVDEAIGAVAFDEKMPPVDKANALMKAETKAKRRVSLSIAGLGLPDESELDGMKRANASSVTDAATREDNSVEALNAAIAEAKPEPEPKPIDVQILPPAASEATPTVATASLPQTDAGKPTAPQPVDPQAQQHTKPETRAAEPSQPVRPPGEAPLAGPDGFLTEETVRQLEVALVALSEHDMKRAMGFLIARRQLQAGKPLNTMLHQAAGFILRNPTAFWKKVEDWSKTQTN